MAVDKIIVIPAGPLTGNEVDTMMDKANVHRNAANPVFDDNGVIQRVEVNLPPAASADAATKINQNNGISTAIEGGIIPGTIGIDGTLAQYDTYKVSTGVTETNLGVSGGTAASITDNGDGTLSIDSTHPNGVSYRLQSINTLLPHPNVSLVELRFKFNSLAAVDLARVEMNAKNGSYSTALRLDTAGQIIMEDFGGGVLDSWTPDTSFHILETEYNGLTVTYKLDGVVINSFTGPAGFDPIQTELRIVSSGADSDIDIDYFRWTENV